MRLDKYVREASPPTPANTLRVGPTRRKEKRAPPGNDKRARFPGFPENTDQRLPKQKGSALPYRFCVSKKWLKENQIHMRRDPENFTIFGLHIPDADYDGEDLAFLADDEASNDDDEPEASELN